MKRNKKTKKSKRYLMLFIGIILALEVYAVHVHNNNAKENENINIANSNIINNEEAVGDIEEDKKIKMTIIGDVMCHNSQYTDAYISGENTYDFEYVFEDVKDYLQNSDITIGNLETTFAGKEKGYSNYPQFNSPEQLGVALKNVGIDVLSTANNHCMDTGYAGLESTLNFLDKYEIYHMGTNRSAEEQNTVLIKDVNGIKIAFLSFTYGTNGIPIPVSKTYAVNLIDEELIIAQLELAKKENPDLICVNMHWGIEYQNVENQTQENLADFLFKNGVDIILGSHPHVLQPMEKKEIKLENGETKNCFVIYSLGNFISGQTKKYTNSSIILNINISKNGISKKVDIEDISYIPIYMYKSNAQLRKYKVLDMEKEITKFETGEEDSIENASYQKIKSEYERIKEMYSNLE